MYWKKNAFGYCMWILYTLLVAGALLVCFAFGAQRIGLSAWVGMPACAVFLGLMGLVVCLVYRSQKDGQRMTESGNPALIAMEVILLVGLAAVGVVFRIYFRNWIGDGRAYFEAAAVAQGQKVPLEVHGAVYWYLHFLHAVCLLFGNKLLACVYAQVVLQIGAGLVLYVAIRRLTGIGAAFFTFAFLMFSPYMIKESLTLSPRMFFLLLYSSALCMIAGVLQKKRKNPAWFVAAGLASSLVCYLDVTGVTLLFVMLGVLYLSNRKTGLGYRFLLLFSGLVGFAAGFVGLLAIDGAASKAGMKSVFATWRNLYRPEGFGLPLSVGDAVPFWEMLLILGMLTVLSLGIFSFWCKRRVERQSILMLIVLPLITAQGLGIMTPEIDGLGYLYLMAAALMGVGAANLFVGSPETPRTARAERPLSMEEKHPVKEKPPMEEKPSMKEKPSTEEKPPMEEKPSTKEKPSMEEKLPMEEKPSMKEKPSMEEKPSMKEKPSMEENPPEKKQTEEKKPKEKKPKEKKVKEKKPKGKKPEEKKPPREEKPQELQKPPETAEAPKVKYLENPLPLPKQHVPKTLEYDWDVQETADYDVDVSETDDFDI